MSLVLTTTARSITADNLRRPSGVHWFESRSVKTTLEDGARLSKRPFSAQVELLEREAELAAVEALIGDPLDTGRLLAIEGAPGIGKTSLIAETRARAHAAGIQVSSARGSELESAFSYGVVRQLFEPLLSRESADKRAELLASAAALAAPLFDPAELASKRAETSRSQRSTVSTG